MKILNVLVAILFTLLTVITASSVAQEYSDSSLTKNKSATAWRIRSLIKPADQKCRRSESNIAPLVNSLSRQLEMKMIKLYPDIVEQIVGLSRNLCIDLKALMNGLKGNGPYDIPTRSGIAESMSETIIDQLFDEVKKRIVYQARRFPENGIRDPEIQALASLIGYPDERIIQLLRDYRVYPYGGGRPTVPYAPPHRLERPISPHPAGR